MLLSPRLIDCDKSKLPSHSLSFPLSITFSHPAVSYTPLLFLPLALLLSLSRPFLPSRWVALCGTFYYAHTNESTSPLKAAAAAAQPHHNRLDMVYKLSPSPRPTSSSSSSFSDSSSSSPSSLVSLVNAWRERFEQVCRRHQQGLAPGTGFAPGQGLGSSHEGYDEGESGSGVGMGLGVFNEDNDEGAGDECGWLAVPSVARRVRWEGEHAGVFAKALLAEPVVLSGLLKLSNALALVLDYSISPPSTQALQQGLGQGLGQGLKPSPPPQHVPPSATTTGSGGGNNIRAGKANRIPHPLLLSLASLARTVLKVRHTL